MEAKIRLIYILAASHSGSTLLSLLLGAHPDICTAGELKATNLDDKERYLCSCGQIIKKCQFWNSIAQKMKEYGINFNVTESGTNFNSIDSAYCRRLLAPLHRGPILEKIRDFGLWLSPKWRKHFMEVQKRNTLLIKSILKVSGKKIIVDSSKIGLRLKFLLKNPQLDIKVIRLVRDGRAVALTYVEPALYADARDPSLRQGGTGGRREKEKKSIEEASYEWLRSNEEAEEILKCLPADKWIQVHYEDYCRNPQQIFQKIFEFIGVDSKAWNWSQNKSYEHHIIGNGMRLDWDGSVKLDERWRQALSKNDLAIFQSIAGSMNRKLGYM